METSDPGHWDELARTRFRVPGLRPFQKEVISALLSDGNPRILAVMPTGSGKSLCFTLPALVHPGPTLVIYPLKALMQDQMRRFRALDLPCGLLQGGQTKPQREEVFRTLKEGRIRFLLANPEVLQQPRIMEKLKETVWSQVILDEVHCVTTWGDTFRPAYLALRQTLDSLKYRVLAGFTATAGPEVRSRIQELIFSPLPAREMICDPDRPNIRYLRWPSAGRRWALEEAIRRFPTPALVFCRTRQAARMTAVFLARAYPEKPVRFFHAGLSTQEKSRLQDWFFTTGGGILCTTKAFGMGVDKPDIRTVIHWDEPESLEDFLQESGRGGRDGETCWSLVLSQWTETVGTAASGKKHQDNRECLRKALLGPLGWKGNRCGSCGPCLNLELPLSPPLPGGRSPLLRQPHILAAVLWGKKTPGISWIHNISQPSWASGNGTTLEALEELCKNVTRFQNSRKDGFSSLFTRFFKDFQRGFLAKILRKG